MAGARSLPLVRTPILPLAASLALATSALAGPSYSVVTRADEPARAAHPLAGITVVLDPGHQLGNARFPRRTGRLVDAGGFRKPCNTTGTQTDAGFPESTFAFDVATRVRGRLESLGATVVMTRNRNSHDLWGPCVD